jgi:hypothetical protein
MKNTPTHKHANFFAPILICLVFGSAIVLMFPFFFQSQSSAKVMSYEDCSKLKNSTVQETYPPVCITKSGKSYVKNLPKIKMPEGQ